MSTVFLVGMPGVGKTHWGRIWSQDYDFRFYDLDELIEHTAGLSVAEIITGMGENAFRELESEVLLETVNRSRDENSIISCGGGTPVVARNLRLMLRTGCVVYLQAPPGVLLKQLNDSPVARPLLKQPDTDSLGALLEKRKYYYEQAHMTLPLGNAAPGTFAEIIDTCINRHS